MMRHSQSVTDSLSLRTARFNWAFCSHASHGRLATVERTIIRSNKHFGRVVLQPLSEMTPTGHIQRQGTPSAVSHIVRFTSLLIPYDASQATTTRLLQRHHGDSRSRSWIATKRHKTRRGAAYCKNLCDDGQKTKSENSDFVSHGGDACGNLSPRLLNCRQRRAFLPPVSVSFGGRS